MSKSKKKSREGRLGTALGALAFASIGTAVVLVPKVRRAVIGAAGMAYEAIRDCCDESGSSDGSDGPPPRETEPRPRPAEPVRPKTGHRRIAEEQSPKTSAPRSAQAKREPSRKGGTTKTTSPGFVNPNDQKVIRRAGKSERWKRQYVYELECGECGHRYGAHGPEIKNRLCPDCQGGAEGEPT